MMKLSRILRLPGGVVTHLLWRVGLSRPPDRKLLEDVIFARYRNREAFPRVLICGVARYSAHYPALFANQEVMSLDRDPDSARYGAERHLTDTIQNLGQYVAPGYFDVILMNGLIGYGVNDRKSAETAVAVCHRHLREGGELLLSTDEGRPFHGQLSQVTTLQEGFTELDFPSLGPSAESVVPWRIHSTHVFHFYRKKG